MGGDTATVGNVMTLTDQLPAPQGTPKSRARPGPCSINPGMPEVGGVVGGGPRFSGDLFPGGKQQVQASGPAPTALAGVFYLIAASVLCQRM